VAETLLIAVVMLAGFVVVFVVDAHGKSRAFEHGRVDHHRPPEAVTGVELPPPRFNQRESNPRRRDS
jgi:hypothetical protein